MAGLRERQGRRMRRWAVVLGLVGVVVIAAAVAGILVLGPRVSSAESTEPSPTGSGTVTSERYRDLTGVGPESAPDTQGAPQQLEGEPFRTCEVCHPDFLEKPVQDADHDLIFSHQVHLDHEQQCVTCHEPPLGHFDRPAPMMMACLGCHEGGTAPNECGNCHRKIEEIAPGLDEPVVHLDPDATTRTSCEKCHDVDVWCEECHGVVMPHPGSWLAAHTESAYSHSDTCVKCHQSRDPAFCVTCHGVEMPHPAYWHTSHGDTAAVNPDVCRTCHPRAPQFCNECHHAGFSPTPQWTPSQHGQVVGTSGTGTCFVCHGQAFCAECHAPGEYVKR